MVFRDDRSLVGPTLITTIYLVLFRHMGFFIRQRRDIKMKPLHTQLLGTAANLGLPFLHEYWQVSIQIQRATDLASKGDLSSKCGV